MTSAPPTPALTRHAGASLVLLAAVAAMLLAAPTRAQDTGTSGVPLGPANINGLNGVLRDPSGIGNAARIPPLPQPNLNPVPVPQAAPLRSTQPVYTPRLRSTRQWRHLSKRQREKLERAAVKENDRLLKNGATSICRGC